MQAGGLSRAEGRGVHHKRGHDVVPAPGVRAVSQASGRGSAHGVHETEEAGHRAAGLQRRAGQDPEGPGRDSAGRQQMQTAELQGLRRALQGLHDRQVRYVFYAASFLRLYDSRTVIGYSCEMTVGSWFF